MMWGDLLAVVRWSPQSSALQRAIGGEDSPWDLLCLLMAEAVDSMHIANWLQTEDGSKGRNRPEPIPRPGVKKTERENYEPMTIQETMDWLGWEVPNDASELAELATVERAKLNRKLSPEQVREIRSSTETRKALAERFGVSTSTVSAAANGRTYQDIT